MKASCKPSKSIFAGTLPALEGVLVGLKLMFDLGRLRADGRNVLVSRFGFGVDFCVSVVWLSLPDGPESFILSTMNTMSTTPPMSNNSSIVLIGS